MMPKYLIQDNNKQRYAPVAWARAFTALAVLVIRSNLLILCVNLFFIVIYADLAMAAEGDAIVILKASILDEDKESMNICLYRNSMCTYISPTEPYVEVSPGMYRLWNVDFTDDKKKEKGSIHFEKYEKFGFKANKIYLIGHLQLSENNAGSYKMEFIQDLSLLKDACKSLSGKARNLPLANAKTGNELEFSCDQVLGNDS